MAAFNMTRATPPASTAWEMVEPADFDREVIILSLTSDANIAFTEADVTNVNPSVSIDAIPSGGFRFTLPAAQALWGYKAGSAFNFALMVTKTDT